ncbi:uncharacterized protein LOC141685979 [Apium graveolens]|uniref:uncharacterized protein LOC141685979 n=1 Tax=Apium graveolens TaxID=4045 RepID=UPI003D79A29E
MNTISPDIRQSVMYMNTNKAIWDDLVMRFSQTNVPKLFNLIKELAYLTQGNMNIFAYFTKFRTLNDELDELADVPRCNCGKCSCENNIKIEKYLNDVKLSQFLMGLSDQYTVVRGHLLLMVPTPTLSAAYSVLLQEENQRECKFSSGPDSVAMSVKNQTSQIFQRPSANNKNSKIVNAKVSESTLYCDFCQMTGHNRDKCFCIHGFPEWHRMYGKPKPKPRTQKQTTTKSAHAYTMINESTGLQSNTGTKDYLGSTTANDGFTNTQYQQLLSMIQSSFKELNSSTTHHASSSNVWSAPSTSQLAGTVMHFACPALNTVTFSSDMWILDSGVTDHITPHFNLLKSVKAVNTTLHLPNGQLTSVTYVGVVELHNSIVLTDVLFVPSFQYNLISIPKLTQNAQYGISFTKDTCTLQDLSLKRSKEIGSFHGGLYILQNPVSLSSVVHSSASVSCNIALVVNDSEAIEDEQDAQVPVIQAVEQKNKGPQKNASQLVGQCHEKNKQCANIAIGLDYDALNSNKKIIGDRGKTTANEDVPVMLKKVESPLFKACEVNFSENEMIIK